MKDQQGYTWDGDRGSEHSASRWAGGWVAPEGGSDPPSMLKRVGEERQRAGD